MSQQDPNPGRSRFSAKSLRMMKEATHDAGYRFLRPAADLPMLLAFLERFDRLGWLPPFDAEKRQVLAAHDVIMHAVRGDLCFYEFCSRGARGERDPWLSIFFHVDESLQIRICGIEETRRLAHRREFFVSRIRGRVVLLDQWLRRREEK